MQLACLLAQQASSEAEAQRERESRSVLPFDIVAFVASSSSLSRNVCVPVLP